MHSANVTLGTTRYAVHRPWPGPDFDFSGISDVAVLSNGHIAVARRVAPQMLIFTAAGELVDRWNIDRLVCMHYVRATRPGGVLVTDVDGHQIVALDARGNTEWVLGESSRPNWMAPFNHPTCACLDAAGNLYVTDGYGNSCLHAFDSKRELRYTVGGQGQAAGKFSTPHSLLHLHDGHLLVADRENNRLQRFDTAGAARGEVTDVFKPMGLAQMADGTVLVTDQTPRLSRFSEDGSVLVGRCRTFSTFAHGVAAAPDGSVYLAEMAPDVVTRLVPLPP